MENTFFIPADVPAAAHNEYHNNYLALTRATERLFLFAADHKMEHLDADFYGPGIDPKAHHPEHLFKIAQKAPIGALATQLGLIARFGSKYPHINYVAKLNSKTNLIPPAERDPFSNQLWSVHDVLTLKEQSGLKIRAIGLTIYLGSEYEDRMLAQAAQTIFQAHQYGLVAILWMYPRSKHIKNEQEAHLLAGAVGVATCLGADFVKIHPPLATGNASSADLLEFIIQAAGNTKVICAGGKQRDPGQLLKDIEQQLSKGSSGVAIGRNIFEHSVDDAVALANKIAALVYNER